jgi:hypothetical protein
MFLVVWLLGAVWITDKSSEGAVRKVVCGGMAVVMATSHPEDRGNNIIMKVLL